MGGWYEGLGFRVVERGLVGGVGGVTSDSGLRAPQCVGGSLAQEQ